jgi:hypothetical protein
MNRESQQTGLVSHKCYAGALADCDGGPTTLEHFVSKGLLERLGREEAFIEGLPWIETPCRLTTNIVSRMLCERHNGKLSASDTAMCQLYDALENWQGGHSVVIKIDGDALERCALKMLVGFAASGNLCPADGGRSAKAVPPESWLNIIFCDAPFPDGCGFYFSEQPIRAVDDGLAVRFSTAPPGEPAAGSLIGIGIQLLGFTFIISIWKAKDTGRRLWYRPTGFRLSDNRADKGEILLSWKDTSSSSNIIPLKL